MLQLTTSIYLFECLSSNTYHLRNPKFEIFSFLNSLSVIQSQCSRCNLNLLHLLLFENSVAFFIWACPLLVCSGVKISHPISWDDGVYDMGVVRARSSPSKSNYIRVILNIYRIILCNQSRCWEIQNTQHNQCLYSDWFWSRHLYFRNCFPFQHFLSFVAFEEIICSPG